MLAEKKVSKKRNQLIAIAIVVVLIITAGLLYLMLASPSDLEDIGVLVSPSSSSPTTINTDVLQDERIQNLQQFGPGEVTVQSRGQNSDPFKAF